MTLENPFNQFRSLINTMEVRVQELSRQFDVEHLSGPQGMVVLYLLEHQEDEVFIKDIESRLQISKSVASNLIKRMVKNGFVEVIPSKKDKRYKQVVLTALGRDKADHIYDFHRAFKKELLEGIEEKDFQTAMRVTDQIKQNIESVCQAENKQ